MREIVIDSETDGYQDVCTKIHVLGWTEDGNVFNHTGDYDKIREVLSGDHSDRRLVCHNAIRFDLMVFNRILGTNLTYLDFIDTLPLSWTINYDRSKHGLESYGEDFGVPKPVIKDWENLTYEDYSHRVCEDVKINWLLWQDLKRKLGVLYS